MSKNFEGALWALGATVMFAIAIAMSKLAAQDFHILEILFFRQAVIFCYVLPAIVRHFPNNLKTKHPITHAFRLVGGFATLSISLWAVTFMPLTTVVVLLFSSVFFVSILATIFLDEKIGIYRILSIVIGFAGVIIVVRPDFGSISDASSLVVLIAALGTATAIICVRKLTQVDSTVTLLTYQALFVGLLSGVPMFWLWQTPSFSDFLFLIAIGVISTAAQWVAIHALRLGEASLISALRYTEIIYATALGFWLFDELPDVYTLGGATLIIASALFMIQREKIKSQKTA
ncbi:MAG: DMT family transporter [Pseudomonas marincola]